MENSTEDLALAVGTMRLAWDPATRVATLQFLEETRGTGDHAVPLIAALSRWIGAGREPFALLGDGAGLAAVDAGYRSQWGAFFREHRDHAFIAFFHMGPLIRVAAEMFRLGTGTRLKAFATEVEARSWLRGMGIAA